MKKKVKNPADRQANKYHEGAQKKKKAEIDNRT